MEDISQKKLKTGSLVGNNPTDLIKMINEVTIGTLIERVDLGRVKPSTSRSSSKPLLQK